MSRRQIHLISFVLVIGLGLPQGAWAQDPNLVGWWKLDETAGTVVNDSSGAGNNGIVIGNPQWVAGQINGALKLNGSEGSSDHIDLSIGSVIAKLDQATLSLWVNWSGLNNTWARIIDFATATGEETYTYIYVVPSDATGKLRTAITVNSSWSDLIAPSGFPSGDWHHLAVTLGDKNDKRIRLCVDGLEVASSSCQWILSELGNTTQNWLGRSYYSADPYLNGILDDFRIYNRILSDSELQDVMIAGSYTAFRPAPKDGTTDVVRDPVLTWSPGPSATKHDVYLGTVFADVNNATPANPLGVLVSQGQIANTYDPAGLFGYGQSYFWRVDEVGALPTDIVKGKVWTFTSETYGYKIDYPVRLVKATASSQSNALTVANKTIDGSGLDTLDQHSTSLSQSWLSKKNQTPVWIQYEFDKVYSLHEMWVWNSNQEVEPDYGYGAKDVTIETSTDGTTWTALTGVSQFAQGTGEPNYVHNTTVAFGGVQAKYVRLNIATNWAGSTKQAGLSEVRFFYVPVKAFEPTPVTGATEVAVDAVLNWRPGRKAAMHDVYLDTDPNAVLAGTAPVKTVTDHRCDISSFTPEYGRTYYWKVNEVNVADTPKSWEGDVWSFSIPDYSVVDDFESYNDKCNPIFYAWVDGFGATKAPECGGVTIPGNGSGASVGNPGAPYAERRIIHGGTQSMPLFYDNPAATSYSEATRTFDVAQDWKKGGAKTLVLYFHGDPGNGAGQVYVKINGSKVVYTSKPDALTKSLWYQWNIDLSSVGGNLGSVGSLTIGVSGTGKGGVYVDDIRLYRAAPPVAQPVDPGTTNRMAYYAMEGDAKDGSGHGYNGTLVADPVFTNGATGFGQALVFDGINDHVELSIAPLLTTLTSSTFAAWVNCDTSETPIGIGWERVFDFGTGTSVYMYMSVRNGTTLPMRAGISLTGNTNMSLVDSTAPLPRGWHHVALVIDGTAMTMQIYLDGTPMGSAATTLVPKDLGVTTQNWLGRSQWTTSAAATSDSYYKGMMDDFAIYNRALSEGELRYLAGDR